MNQQRNGRGMYTDPSSGYRYEGNLTILWCGVLYVVNGGGGREGGYYKFGFVNWDDLRW